MKIKATTPVKAAFGYILLTLLLILSIGYIYNEMRTLTQVDAYEGVLMEQRQLTNRVANKLYQAEIVGQSISVGSVEEYVSYRTLMQKVTLSLDSLRPLLTNDSQLLRLDTVQLLLRQKARNMRRLLETIEEASSERVYQERIEALVNEPDSLLVQPRISNKVVTRSNTYTIHKKPKRFFKRIAEAFAPAKSDSTQVKNVIHEVYNDTLIGNFNPADTVVSILKGIQEQVIDSQQQAKTALTNRIRTLQLNGLMLNQKVNQLLTTIEQEELLLDQLRAEKEEVVRNRSVKSITAIALAAIVLAFFFFLLVWRDVTRSNHYRNELEKAKLRAEELLKLRESLMLTITHDIKAPTGSILGYIELLTSICPETKQQFYLSNMHHSATHLLNLVHSLLDFHRLEAHKVEVQHTPFVVSELLETIATSFVPLADKKGIALKWQFDELPAHVYISDPFRLRQVVENLLSNAIKFTEKGEVKVVAFMREGKLELSVSDTGSGIPAEEQTRLFKAFTRLKNAQAQEGFGLGLAITYRLIELLKGAIYLRSEVGKGSTFFVTIPLPQASTGVEELYFSKKEQEVNSQQTAVTEWANGHYKIKVLLIDDDPIQLQLTIQMLQSLQMDAVGTLHPQEVLTKLQQENIDLLLTDLQMPEMNGIELLQAIRQLKGGAAASIPVIAVTARSELKLADITQLGFAQILHKPFSQRELKERIEEVLGGKLASISTTDKESQEESPVKVEYSYRFEALTFFSEDDKEAAIQIIDSFINESISNVELLELGMKEHAIDKLTQLAHKMLPIFSMIEAHEAVAKMRWMEEQKELSSCSNELLETARCLLIEVNQIIQAAQLYRGQLRLSK
ncbi:MAG: hybrid sensor histidine kinase/response regulator [Phocaeicola sp.]